MVMGLIPATGLIVAGFCPVSFAMECRRHTISFQPSIHQEKGTRSPPPPKKNTNVCNEVVHFRHPAIPVCRGRCVSHHCLSETHSKPHRLRMGCELGSRMNQKQDHQFLHPIHIVYARHKKWTGTFCRVMQRSYNQRSRFSLFCVMTKNQKKRKPYPTIP